MKFEFPVPTDHMPGGWHHAYIPVYEWMFESMRTMAALVIEIGCDGGGGALMYASYFTNATVFSIDVSPMPDSLKDAQRVVHFQRDAYTPETIEFLGSKNFDVIIDDGPHTLGSQQFFVQNYPNLLGKEGLAVVEDIQEYAHIGQLAKCLQPGFSGMAIDQRHVNDRYDDLLFFIWRQ